MSTWPPLLGAKRVGLAGLAMLVLGAVVLALGACASGGSGDEDSSKERAGRLMFSRFDEATHTFISTHTAEADGTDEKEITLPGPEGGGRWSRRGDEIAVMTLLPDERVGTAIIEPDGTVVRTLEIADKSLNLVCKVWSPDDKRLACEGWDEADPSRNGIYTVRSSDGEDLRRLTTTPEGVVDFPGDYSPDGAQFVFKRSADEEEGPLMIIDLPDGEPRPMSKVVSRIPGASRPTEHPCSLRRWEHRDHRSERRGPATGHRPTPLCSAPSGRPMGVDCLLTGNDRPTRGILRRPDGTDAQQVTSTAAVEITVEWGPGKG